MIQPFLRRLNARIKRLSCKYQMDSPYFPGLEYEQLEREFLQTINEYKLSQQQ